MHDTALILSRANVAVEQGILEKIASFPPVKGENVCTVVPLCAGPNVGFWKIVENMISLSALEKQKLLGFIKD